MRKLLTLCILNLALSVSVSLATESTTIATILANLDTYQLQNVNLRGTITQIHSLPPYVGRLGPIYGACTFLLNDGTGTIEVQVERNCVTSELETSSSQKHVLEVSGRVQVLTRELEQPTVVLVASGLTPVTPE